MLAGVSALLSLPLPMPCICQGEGDQPTSEDQGAGFRSEPDGLQTAASARFARVAHPWPCDRAKDGQGQRWPWQMKDETVETGHGIFQKVSGWPHFF